jgi:hypothetical protein
VVPDEETLRKSCFDLSNSVPIVLADGQTWFLPKPWLEIRPVFRLGRAYSAGRVLTYGDDLDQRVKEIGQCTEESAIIAAIASLGAYLLSVTYELRDSDLEELFHFRVGDQGSLDWAKQVMDVATGQSGPKVFSGGGDFPS